MDTSGITVIDGMVHIGRFSFPIDIIRDAMLETGGILVVQNELIAALDRARIAARETGKEAKLLTLSHLPMVYFVPKRIVRNVAPPGQLEYKHIQTESYLYFAVKRGYRGASLSS